MNRSEIFPCIDFLCLTASLFIRSRLSEMDCNEIIFVDGNSKGTHYKYWLDCFPTFIAVSLVVDVVSRRRTDSAR